MSSHSQEGDGSDLDTEVPEADAAEQAVTAVPDGDGPESRASQGVIESGEADPADAWEQSLPVPGDDDEEYEHDDP